MLPNPTNTILPANFTCTSLLLIILVSFWFALAFGLILQITPAGRTPPAYLAARNSQVSVKISGGCDACVARVAWMGTPGLRVAGIAQRNAPQPRRFGAS